jgi:hypothetical protein
MPGRISSSTAIYHFFFFVLAVETRTMN